MSSSKESAVGARWSSDEESRLLIELRDGHPIKEIADHHTRTIGAITALQKLIALRMLEKGATLSSAAKATRLTEDVIKAEVSKTGGGGTTPAKKESELELLREIRDLLKEINQRGQRL